MTTEQALGLALLLFDYELECPQVEPVPKGWQRELLAARQVVSQMLTTLNPATKYTGELWAKPPGSHTRKSRSRDEGI